MLLIYTILYFLSIVLYRLNYNYIASILMIILAIFLYVNEVKRTKRIVNVRGLFVLGFVGGFGVSLLKLSSLSSKYSFMTIIAVFVSYFSIYLGVYFAERNRSSLKKDKDRIIKTKSVLTSGQKLVLSMCIVTFIAFLVEVIKLKFVPLFTINTPHAYSTFHVFMVHYITSFYSFIPSIAICNYYMEPKDKMNVKFIIVSFVYVVIMSLLLVSRSRLILSVVMSIFVVAIYSVIDKKSKKKFSIPILVVLPIAFVLLYIIITINRAHDVEYLNGIFEMKNDKLPIFISQPYMYIAHNFENLNYMINYTFRWTFGRRMLYPLFTLTLIKKFFPIVVDSPYYIIKQELSTVTLIYDAYYDFGLVGVIVFCFIIGYIGKKLEDKTYDVIQGGYKNNYLVVLYALYCYFMLFSFFQTYFSLTDTWVYIIILVILSKFFVMEKHNN